MDNLYSKIFDKNWDKFVTRLQGRLMTQAKNGGSMQQSSNLILADCIGFWDSRHSEGGRWLENYERECPEKAEMVKNILLNDMKFEEYSSGVSQKGYMKYMVPIGCAAAGFGLSKISGADTVIQTVCTIAPAAAAYPVTINALRAGENSRKKQMIQNYLSQLNKYKVSIESILQDM